MPSYNAKHFPLPKDYLTGFRTACSSNDVVTIQTGICRDFADSCNLEASSPLSANISVSGANGLDTGAEASNTWYAVHVIASSVGANSEAALFSLSSTAPTLPSGYGVFRHVGWVRNDGSSNLFQFRTYGETSYKEYRYDYRDTAGGGNILRALSAGLATTQTLVSIATWIPPVTLDTMWYAKIGVNSAVNVAHTGRVYPSAFSATEFMEFEALNWATLFTANYRNVTIGTSSARTFDYLVSVSVPPNNISMTVWVLGYWLQL